MSIFKHWKMARFRAWIQVLCTHLAPRVRIFIYLLVYLFNVLLYLDRDFIQGLMCAAKETRGAQKAVGFIPLGFLLMVTILCLIPLGVWVFLGCRE